MSTRLVDSSLDLRDKKFASIGAARSLVVIGSGASNSAGAEGIKKWPTVQDRSWVPARSISAIFVEPFESYTGFDEGSGESRLCQPGTSVKKGFSQYDGWPDLFPGGASTRADLGVFGGRSKHKRGADSGEDCLLMKSVGSADVKIEGRQMSSGGQNVAAWYRKCR